MVCALSSLADNNAVYIKLTDGITNVASIADIDSIYFSDDQQTMYIFTTSGNLYDEACSKIENISYSTMPASLTVIYEGEQASIVNPYFLNGVSVSKEGAHVVVTNTNESTEYTTTLSGSTTNGSFLYNGTFKTTLVLNGVNITNPTGGAVDIQCGKRITMELKKGTDNVLVDGSNGQQKAALYCKGHLEIDKSGNLTVTGNAKHAVSTKEYLQIKNGVGKITILGAESDGIHAGQYFQMNGGEIVVEGVKGDAVQAEATGAEGEELDGQVIIKGGKITATVTADGCDAMKADSLITINAEKSFPELNLTVKGAAGKGISTNGDILVSAGVITINNSGNGLTENNEGKTAKCIGADGNITLLGGEFHLTASGSGGKGIKADGMFVVGDKTTGEGPLLNVTTTGEKYTTTATNTGGSTGGSTGGTRPGGNRPGWGSDFGSDNASSAKAIKAEGAIYVYGGNMNLSTAKDGAEGFESKTSITVLGGQHYMNCYDDCINSSGVIRFDGGVTICKSYGNDAIDSNYGRTGAIVIGDGVVFAYTTKGGPEMGLDCDGNNFIQITGNGTVITAGGNQGGGGWGGSSGSTITGASQGYKFVTTTISYQKGRYYTLADASGKNLVTYSFEDNVSSSCAMFTAKGMTSGSSYTVKYSTVAPTDATVAFHGLYLGSTAAGTTSVTSFTAN